MYQPIRPGWRCRCSRRLCDRCCMRRVGRGRGCLIVIRIVRHRIDSFLRGSWSHSVCFVLSVCWMVVTDMGILGVVVIVEGLFNIYVLYKQKDRNDRSSGVRYDIYIPTSSMHNEMMVSVPIKMETNNPICQRISWSFVSATRYMCPCPRMNPTIGASTLTDWSWSTKQSNRCSSCRLRRQRICLLGLHCLFRLQSFLIGTCIHYTAQQSITLKPINWTWADKTYNHEFRSSRRFRRKFQTYSVRILAQVVMRWMSWQNDF